MAKTLFLSIVFAFCLAWVAQPVFAQQNIAYIDIALVMDNLPEAQDAQRMLDNQVDKWQKELDALEVEWKEKYEDYDKRKLILTNQGRANMERDLQALDAEIMEFREKKFGQNGELFTKEAEIMRPIQNMVFEQVKVLAKEKGYDYVVDKSGAAILLYANEKHDLTNELIKRIESALPARTTPAGTGFEEGSGGQKDGGQRKVPTPPKPMDTQPTGK
jgi:outer membrane protein